jgi:cell division transport system permease protein
MQTFTQQLGIAGVLDVLGENPLPHVIVLEVNESHRAPTQLDALVKELTALSNVDLAQLDTEWLKKLNAILAAFERGVWVIAVFLAVAVLLTIGNTINLSIQNRLEEIEVMKLVGAKDAFIRRPFLYGGFWLGVISGLLALILLLSSYLLLSEPLTQVMTLYGGVFEVPADLVFDILGGLMLCAAALGWVGAWIAVARQLHRIEPR